MLRKIAVYGLAVLIGAVLFLPVLALLLVTLALLPLWGLGFAVGMISRMCAAGFSYGFAISDLGRNYIAFIKRICNRKPADA